MAHATGFAEIKGCQSPTSREKVTDATFSLRPRRPAQDRDPSIQHSLQLSRRELASLDYGVPGSTRLAQREAVWDLLGRRVGGAEGGGVPGSWQRLVKEIRRSTDSAQLVSEELLVHARPRHARRIAQELEPFELSVVVTVRDLTTAVPSMWQQRY